MTYKSSPSEIWISLYPFSLGTMIGLSLRTSMLPFVGNGCKQLKMLVLPDPFGPVSNTTLLLDLLKSISIVSVLNAVTILMKFVSFRYKIFMFFTFFYSGFILDGF